MTKDDNVVYLNNFRGPKDFHIPEEWVLQFYDPATDTMNFPEAVFQAYRDTIGDDRGNLEVYWSPTDSEEDDHGEYVFVIKDPETSNRAAYTADSNYKLQCLQLPRK